MEPEQHIELRRQAEEKLDEKIKRLKDKLDNESLRLLHEFKVHQVELEMQNEELRRTQVELERVRDRYADLFEVSPVGLLTLDRNGAIVEANRTLAAMLGVQREHLLGIPFGERVDVRDKNLLDKFLRGCSRQERQHTAELRLQRPDGSVLDARMGCLCLAVGHAGEPENRLSITDLTERKKLEEREIQAQKLESLGLLAGGIAHDFNNLLTAMLGSISLARMYLDPGSQAVEKMKTAERAALRARDLTKRLLTFARCGEPVTEPVAVAKLVREMAGLSLKGPQTFDFDFPPDLWPVKADAGQVGQVIQNLVMNALQAMPQGGEIEIWGRNVELAPENALDLPAGRYVRVAVSDQGPGIAPEILGKIFDPYFTTKKEGSGLGLAVSRSIVMRHGGRLTADSTPGRGALFEIYLPAAEERPLEQAAEAPTAIRVGKGRILVMDDEESVLLVTAELVGHLGYEAATARDGREALRLYEEARQEGRPFGAVILDLVVPGGMGGEETVAELRKIDPGVKAVVSSGYSDHPAARDYQSCGFCAAMPKPYRLAELSRILHEVMAGDGG